MKHDAVMLMGRIHDLTQKWLRGELVAAGLSGIEAGGADIVRKGIRKQRIRCGIVEAACGQGEVAHCTAEADQGRRGLFVARPPAGGEDRTKGGIREGVKRVGSRCRERLSTESTSACPPSQPLSVGAGMGSPWQT